MAINILVFVIGAYCVLESISAAADMDRGDRYCRVAKFLFSLVSGAYAAYTAATVGATIWTLVQILAVALAIWPRMIFRLFGGQREYDKMKRGA